MEGPPQDLVDAAEAVLERRGWHGLTAELIAQEAGINRVTLYRNGHNAASLVAAAASASADEFREGVLPALADGGTAEHRLTLLLEALFDVADRHLALLALLYDGPTAVFHLSGGGMAATTVTRFEYTEPFERVLRDGLADGTLASTDPARDAELIFNAAGWTYVHLRRSHGHTRGRARSDIHRLVGAFASAAPS